LTVLAAVLFAVFLAVPAHADPEKVFVVTDDARHSLDDYLEFLDDIDGSFSIDQVQRQADKFRPLTRDKKLGYDYKGKALWVRVAIDARNHQEPRWLFTYDYEHIGNLQIYIPTEQGYRRIEMDQHLPQEGRQMLTRGYTVTVPTPPQASPALYYVRLQPGDRFLRVSLVWSGISGQVEELQFAELMNGAFFGALLIMLFYNAVLWRLLRDQAYGFYCYYLACFIATFAHIYGFTALFMRLNPVWEQVYAAAGYGAIHGLILFTRRFLSLPETTKWIDRYLRVFAIIVPAAGLAAFIEPVGTPYKYLNVLILLTMPVTVFAGCRRARQGFTPAIVYTVAWMVFTACLAVLAARSLNLLPMNAFTDYAVRVSSVIEATLLSIALGQRIKLADAGRVRLAEERERILLAERTAVAEAKQAIEEKNRFLSIVTHELRSCLQPMVSSLEGLESRVKDAKLAEYVQRIKHSANRLTSQLRDLLTLSRGQAGRLEILPHPFDASSLVAETADRAGEDAHRKGLQINVELPKQPVLVVADDRRIEQVLSNLISNAIKYTVQGSVNVTLEEFDVEKSQLCFSVQDTGPGIPAQHIPGMFTPFRRLPSSASDTDGSGIGLAVVDTVVRCLAGSLNVKSEEGQGTTFIVTIPAIALPDQAETAADSPRPTKILIVDDQPEILSSLAHELAELGWAVDRAESAAAGANLLAAKRYDLVLVDLNMPAKNGRELALETRRPNGLNCSARIVAISAVETDAGGELWPFDEFLPKPIARRDLVQLLGRPKPFSGVVQ
jgi:signal transduction histidine kinase/CheY-like chemotaxis protein